MAIVQKKTELLTTQDHLLIWEKVVAKLKFSHGDAAFNSWIKPLSFERLDGGHICISAPTRFMRDWITTRYIEDILRFWRNEDSSALSVDVRVKQNTSSKKDDNITHLAADTGNNTGDIISSSTQPDISPVTLPLGNLFDLGEISSNLDPRFTFDNFVVGPTNQLAHAAAKSVAEAETIIPGSNPLFLYGGVGLGKTHLMHAIAWHINKTNPHRKVIYLSAEKFMYQFVRALRNKDIVAFKEYFRSVDVLMIDDVQFICGKTGTQEEFFHTLNTLIDNKRQIVLSADRSPSDLDGMEERIRSRLGWGLVADINTTTYELRLGILETKIEQMKISAPREVVEFLARKIVSNVRELEGALNKVVAHSKLMKQDITIENTQYILRDLLRSNDHTLTIDDIKKAVADHCNVKLSDMNSARRARDIARPRQIAMYLSKKLTTHSLPEIGRKFGGKDHTTVIHAVKKVEQLCTMDKEFRDDVELLTRMLQN